MEKRKKEESLSARERLSSGREEDEIPWKEWRQ